MKADVVIVGAGIVGTSCAYFLAQGGLRVVLVERNGLAGGTSGSGEGNILVSDKAPGPELELAKLGCRLWKDLSQQLAEDFEFEEKGGIVVAETERNLPSLLGSLQALVGAGVVGQLLSQAELREAEPYLAHDVAGAAFFPQDCQVQPMLACAALLRAAVELGANFWDHAALEQIGLDSQGRVERVLTSRGTIETPRVVNAAGPWSPQVSALLGLALPTQPRKGHILVTEPLPRLVHHKVFEASYADTVNSGAAALQVASVVEGTRSGTILMGSSRQLVGFDPAIDLAVLRQIARRAVRYFPVLANVHALRSYVGFRSFAPDHLPLIGPDPDVPGFFINTGHEGAGIGLGPISSRLLAQHILGQPLDLDLSPFLPARFASTSQPAPAGISGR